MLKSAEHINLNLSRINQWWNEKKRKEVIKFFCDNMCKYEGNNIKKLTSILKKIANK